jgi:hypothetical protein
LYALIKKKRPDDRRQTTEEKKLTIEEKTSVIRHSSSVKETFPKEEAVVVLQEMKIEQQPETVNTKPETEFDELQLLEKEMLKEAFRTSMSVDLLKEESTESLVKKSEIRNPKSETHSFNDWLKICSGQKVEEKPIDKKQKSDLIDKFILEETSKAIAKPKAEFYSAETMAKKSITDDENFVTETLASIYLRQGNLPKALRAYEILMVKYPEKIHIFAPLLEKIKNLLKEQKSK